MFTATPVLEELHLPVVDNMTMRQISDLSSLKYLTVDTKHHLTRRGMYHLCHPKAATRKNLLALNIPFFKNKEGFATKLEASRLLLRLKKIRSFNLMDEHRPILGSNSPSKRQKKSEVPVSSYSAFKMASISASKAEMDRADRRLSCLLSTKSKRYKPYTFPLWELKIVDSEFECKNIYQTCPNLRKLTIDWQEKLAFRPYDKYNFNWFEVLLFEDRYFTRLFSQLTHLDITFPASRNPSEYCLSWSSFNRLFRTSQNLKDLRLVGASKFAHMPFLELLELCPLLKKLVLDQCPFLLPREDASMSPNSLHENLTSLTILNETELVSTDSTRLVANIVMYMPKLKTLELLPDPRSNYFGLNLEDLSKLGALQDLERLAIPIAMRDCVCNMPAFLTTLTHFKSLKFLTLGWGVLGSGMYQPSFHRISHLMRWLVNGLRFMNSRVHAQLSHKMHPELRSLCNDPLTLLDDE